jgi:hypothetical protein
MLENITLTVTADEATSYRSLLRLKTKSPSEAKAVSAILSLARTRIGRTLMRPDTAFITELIFGNPPVLDGNTIAVAGTFPMDALISSIKQLSLFSPPSAER